MANVGLRSRDLTSVGSFCLGPKQRDKISLSWFLHKEMLQGANKRVYSSHFGKGKNATRLARNVNEVPGDYFSFFLVLLPLRLFKPVQLGAWGIEPGNNSSSIVWIASNLLCFFFFVVALPNAWEVLYWISLQVNS